MVPYADWNTLKYEDKEQAMEKMLDLTMITDIFPTGYHGCIEARVGPGSTVYIGGGGPVGLAAATSAFFLGAAAVIVGDPNKERREHAHSIGCETVDPLRFTARPDRGDPRCAGGRRGGGLRRVRGEGPPGRHRAQRGGTQPGHGGHPRRRRDRDPRLYVTEDPGARDEAARHGTVSLRFGIGWRSR